MDRYKFRGKQYKTGQFFHGDLLNKPNGTFIGFHSNENDDYDDEYVITQVDPSTVGQYTGLSDKNGKEIYEGDIIQRTNEGKTGIPTYKCVVVHGDGIYYAEYPSREDGEYLFNEWCDDVVIGNIHDNPSLLKGE